MNKTRLAQCFALISLLFVIGCAWLKTTEAKNQLLRYAQQFWCSQDVAGNGKARMRQSAVAISVAGDSELEWSAKCYWSAETLFSLCSDGDDCHFDVGDGGHYWLEWAHKDGLLRVHATDKATVDGLFAGALYPPPNPGKPQNSDPNAVSDPKPVEFQIPGYSDGP